MPENPHIVLTDYKQPKSYTPRSPNIQQAVDEPHFNQSEHGALLAGAYRAALEAVQQQYQQFGIDPAQADQGVAVEMRFREGTKIDVTTLEAKRSGNDIEVLNVKLGADGRPESAILYIPPGREDFIKNQIDSYRNPKKNTKSGKPRGYTKYDKTEDIQPAKLEDFWIDSVPLPQDQAQPATWELWLREGGFAALSEKVPVLGGVTVSAHSIKFPEREICVVHGSLIDLRKLELLTKAITGFRYSRTGGGFFDAMPPAEQQQWQQDLTARLTIADDVSTSVCLLDTGIAADHPLLSPAIAENGVDSVDPGAWGVGDHHGHGTEMAGIALLGDLVPLLEGDQQIELAHLLESVKVFPPNGQNDDEHIGYITAQAVSRAEVNRPDLNRVFTLSWAIGHEAQKNGVQVTAGKPTPLSARIDQLAFGVDEANDWQIEDDRKRLLLVAAGNIGETYNPGQYPAINALSEIEEPGQSWNALTVGAVTDKVFVNDPTYDGWNALAGPGQLSPKTRTSALWGESYWPTKPDIVLEGGNYLANGGYMEPHPDVSPLTTDKDTVFCHTNDTSAANAEASRLAATLSARYPEFWPETLRGLMVHAAEWSAGMLGGEQIAGKPKSWKINFLRRFGYGAPQLDRLLSCPDNRPCIVIQDQLQPFKKSEKHEYVVFNDMNFYALPWPEEKLQEIYDQQVRLRVTLSYFVEPNPSERPPRTKYSYASHELRFRLNRPNETEEQFLARVNKELQQSEQDEQPPGEEQPAQGVQVAEQDKWLLGAHSRDRGSVISDIWRGTGADLAGQNLIAVIPQLGWWKYRKAFPANDQARYGDTVRYALILSLISEAEIDLYTPILQAIEAAQAVEIEV